MPRFDFHGPLLRGRLLLTGTLLTVALLALACSRPGEEAPATAHRSSAEATLEVVDDAGRSVRLPRPAGRIVSLVPAATETLIALGAAELLVARTDYDRAPEVAGLSSVGGGLTPSLELLASLRPDLVVTWEEAGTPRIRLRLEELGIAVFSIATQDTSGVFSSMQRLARLTGREAAGDSLAAAIRAELDSVRASVAELPARSVLYVAGVDPPLAAGRSTFITQLVEVAGGYTVFPELASHWPQISLEEVVRRRPEVVILPVGPDEQGSLERLRRSAGWRELFADGRTRIATVPADTVNRPGPRIGRSARVLREAIHPTPLAGGRP